MKLACLSLVFVAFFAQINCAKVFGFLPLDSSSHFAIGNAILKSLHDAGHEVTVVSPYPQKKPLKKYTDISTAGTPILHGPAKVNAFNLVNIHPIVRLSIMYKMGGGIVETYMAFPQVQELLKSNEKFDVCVIEIFNFEAFLGFADHFDCVLVTYTAFGAVKTINYMTSNEMPSSYVPHPFLHYTDKMSFTERLYNTFISRVEDVLYSAAHLPNQRRLYNKYFPNAKKSMDEMIKNSAIIFVNNHVSSSSSRPILPNIIDICGVHVEEPKPLPTDIQKFLDSATDGAILFSMGSFVKSKDWPEETRESLVKAFGKLKQKVLWKYENEKLPNKSENVMIGSWIPQRDIVAHPNVKLFITHGGLLGTTEALVEGIPVLGIPLFGDQRMNIAKAVVRGYGVQLEMQTLTEEKVLSAINELLNNPEYARNAKLISSRFVDRPMTPKQSVVYWTEFALRHHGASHLRAAGNNLNFFQFHLIDVYFVLSAIVLMFLYIDYLVLKVVFRKIFKKKPAEKKLKKK